MQCGIRYAEAAIVALTVVVWAHLYLRGHLLKLVALPQAVSWGNDQAVKIYNDNQYVCLCYCKISQCLIPGAREETEYKKSQPS